MFKNMSIKNKLTLNLLVVFLGITIIVINVYVSMQKLENEYNHSKNLQEQAGQLKSMLIGGLMLNSAKGVITTNINATTAIKSMKDGIEKINLFYKKLHTTNPKLANSLKKPTQICRVSAKNLISKAQNGIAFSKEDLNHSLKTWRALKKEIMKPLKPLKKDVIESRKRYSEHMNAAITLLIIISIIVLTILLIIGQIISKGIATSINDFKDYLDGFFRFLNRDTLDVDALVVHSNDEIALMAKNVEQNITIIKSTISADRKLIDEVEVVLGRACNGWFSQMVTLSTPNDSLMELKDNINHMLSNMKDRFLNINNQLEKYANHDYIDEFKVDNIEKSGVFDAFVQDVNKLRGSITDMLIENKSNGLTLDNSSDILLKNVDILNRNSNEAAAALEETAAALEEITSNISHNTENVINMSGLASQVTISVSTGQKLASQTSVAMTQIDEQVNSINDAITVIDQIAFQTNILSLNAAVEAATAGEAGKGFAVVAQEVRNLASRSAQAANEIKTLVEHATTKANEGKAISDKMINGYEELNTNITKTIEIISDVEMASKEQQAGIIQINDAVAALDQQTQQNANIAAQTNTVAMQTDDIAKLVVKNANEKEFIGKDSVKAK